MNKLLKNIKIPAAVFGTSDLIIIGAMKSVIRNNYDIPRQVSFLGFDNIFYCEYTNPPLSTIKQPKKIMGEEAMRLMIKLLAGKKLREKKIILQTKLIKRESIFNVAGIS